MAKAAKAGAAQGAAPAPTATPAAEPPEKVSKADMVRAAVEAGHIKPQAAVAWIKDEYGVDMSTGMFSSYKSQHKAAGGEASPRGRKAAGSGEPTLTDLMAAKALADELDMTPAALANLVDKFADFPDLPTLKKCLNTLTELTGGK